jgi:hypothetical protein
MTSSRFARVRDTKWRLTADLLVERAAWSILVPTASPVRARVATPASIARASSAATTSTRGAVPCGTQDSHDPREDRAGPSLLSFGPTTSSVSASMISCSTPSRTPTLSASSPSFVAPASVAEHLHHSPRAAAPHGLVVGRDRRGRYVLMPVGPPVLVDFRFALATLLTRPDDAAGPPPQVLRPTGQPRRCLVMRPAEEAHDGGRAVEAESCPRAAGHRTCVRLGPVVDSRRRIAPRMPARSGGACARCGACGPAVLR